MDIIELRSRIQTEIFDYQTLTCALSNLSSPRDKITDLMKKGIIIRIKKGLYIFGDQLRRYPYSRELLGNLIYGPSYISLDYALSYYGLIPEKVEIITSVTTNRSRRFSTPVGLFTYRQIPGSAYVNGAIRVEAGNNQAFLIATPEKALADKLVSLRGVTFNSRRELTDFLEEDLRINTDMLRSLSAEKIEQFAAGYRSRKLKILAALVRRMARNQRKKDE
ncbi:MAG: type IV toxin-antitoxin system AbiEi family antitoxin domain-containing protein [Candidatus Saccharicenans sp.]|uniref:type IV toxin-antitoxin system AbiEi family antitoxin domain-containing protein n=1 Tax=Candidatus Saccharicenans sp. TaxID=2819258 RepID=UPI0040494F0B